MHQPAPKADGSRLLPAPFMLGDGLGMVDVWQSLHASERGWLMRSTAEQRLPFSEMVEGSDRQLLRLLTNCPAERWVTMCNGIGWEAIDVAALSWCAGVKLGDVLDGWQQLGMEAFPSNDSAAHRAARYLNRALISDRRFSALQAFAPTPFSLCVLLAALGEDVEVDVDGHALAALPPQVQALLPHSRP